MEKINKLYWNMRQDFYKKYREKIVPTVCKYEKSRKTRLFWASFFVILAIIVGLFLTCIQLFGIGEGNDRNIECALNLIILSSVIWYFIKKKFENKVKKEIMPIVCSCFENLEWSQGECSEGKYFSECGLIPTFQGESYDDIFTGSYKNVQLEIIESSYTRGSGKSKHSVFSGVIIKLSMNKSFVSHTLIKPNTLLHKSPVSGLRHTELEDPEFSKKYDVFTNDETDARYLITPSFMERLKNIKTAFDADNVSCVFQQNKLIMALSTGTDLFSICSLVKEMDDKTQYMQMYTEIESIIALIDYFKLDQNIGL